MVCGWSPAHTASSRVALSDASAAFLGGLATTAWLRLHGRRRRVEAVLLGVYATVHCRVFAAERGWRLPAWATAAR